MFERYTKAARGTILMARYMASQVGSPEIETEHLLLGLLRTASEPLSWFSVGSRNSLENRRTEDNDS
jgi:hypothetical protein